MLLDGKKIAHTIYSDLQKNIKSLEKKPVLWAVLVGKNPESIRYIWQKRKFSEKIGMWFQLFSFPENISESELLQKLKLLNENPEISGYIVQLPLPAHINSIKVIEHISPKKDVDGFHPENQGKVMIGDTSGFIPCTPAGVMKILESTGISLLGQNICIIGRSNIVGKPLSLLCINAGATVTSCNSQTKDISFFTKQADIVICATGKAGLLRANMVQKDSIVIDVGFSIIDGKIRWDACFDELLAQWNTITPVPGWVGPMTVAMLLSHTYQAHIWNLSS